MRRLHYVLAIVSVFAICSAAWGRRPLSLDVSVQTGVRTTDSVQGPLCIIFQFSYCFSALVSCSGAMHAAAMLLMPHARCLPAHAG